MGKFVLGIIVTLIVLVLAALGFATFGFFPTRADVEPPHWESHFAMGAADAYIDRHAPRIADPLTPTDQNLEDGMKIYTMNCAECHGTLDRKSSAFGGSFYPPAPNFISDPPDDPEWHTYYTVHNGIRYTGMPAWSKTLPETDIWKVTLFLSHMDKLPPTVQDYWKANFSPAPATPNEKKEGEEKHDHH